MTHTKTYYIKATIFGLMLAVESYFLTSYIGRYVETEMYFTPPWQILTMIAGLMLLILYTYSLTIGGWGAWEQYVLVPLPMSVGVFFGVHKMYPDNSLLIAFAALLLITYDTYFANSIKNTLIYFRPRLILKFSSKGIIFAFSLLGAVLVFLHSNNNVEMFNLGEKIGELTQNQYERLIQPQLNESAQTVLEKELEGRGVPINPETFSMLSGMGIDTNSFVGGLPTIDLNLKDTIETEFNAVMEPYKRFVPSLIALVVFALIRFVGGFVNIVFSITIPLVFAFFKSTKLLHINHVETVKEEISFDSSTKNSPTRERKSPTRTAPIESLAPKS